MSRNSRQNKFFKYRHSLVCSNCSLLQNKQLPISTNWSRKIGNKKRWRSQRKKQLELADDDYHVKYFVVRWTSPWNSCSALNVVSLAIFALADALINCQSEFVWNENWDAIIFVQKDDGFVQHAEKPIVFQKETIIGFARAKSCFVKLDCRVFLEIKMHFQQTNVTCHFRERRNV